MVELNDDRHPQFEITFKGKHADRLPESVDAEEFIAKKGVAAKGKKCSALDIKGVRFIEPLHKPEDDIVREEEQEDLIEENSNEVLIDTPDSEERAEELTLF